MDRTKRRKRSRKGAGIEENRRSNVGGTRRRGRSRQGGGIEEK